MLTTQTLNELELNLAIALDALQKANPEFYNLKKEEILLTHQATIFSPEEKKRLLEVQEALNRFAKADTYQTNLHELETKIDAIRREIAHRIEEQKIAAEKNSGILAWLDKKLLEPFLRQIVNFLIKFSMTLQKTYVKVPGLRTSLSVLKEVFTGIGGVVISFSAPIYYGLTALFDFSRAVIDRTLSNRVTRAVAAVATAGLATMGLLVLVGVMSLGIVPAAMVAAGFYFVGFIKERIIISALKNKLAILKDKSAAIKKQYDQAVTNQQLNQMLLFKKQLNSHNEEIQKLETQLITSNIKLNTQKRSLFFALTALVGVALLAVFPPIGIALIVVGAVGVAVSTGLYVRDMHAVATVTPVLPIEPDNTHHWSIESEAWTFEKMSYDNIEEAKHSAEHAMEAAHSITEDIKTTISVTPSVVVHPTQTLTPTDEETEAPQDVEIHPQHFFGDKK